MLPLVEFPELVQHYAPFFEDVFSEAAFVEFQRYISGLIVSENKTVEGINRLFVNESRNQSSLNRLLTVSPFSLEELNQKRHDLLSNLPGTQMKRDGALSVDDTLLKHYGEHFEQIAYLYDHVEQNYTWAHNLVTLHYSDNETDYPVHFQLWKPADLEKLEQGLQAAGVEIKKDKRELQETAPAARKWRQYLLGLWRRHANQKAEVAALYESKLRIAEALLQEWKQSQPTLNLPVSFDSWYTQPAFCHFIEHDLQMNYVGALAQDQQVVLKTGTEKLADFAARLKQEHLDAVARGKLPVFKPVTIPYKGGKEKYYSYCVTHRIHNFGKKRLVINHGQADLSDNPTCLISNRLNWQAPGITRIYRHRWPVEVYHEESKEEGLDQYQLRSFEAIERHIALVAVVYSLLRAAQHDRALRDKLQRELKIELEGSVPFWRRVTQAQSLWKLALLIQTGLSQGQKLRELMTPLLRAMCST
jgi:hypothetical protein